ncbi:MAG: DUF4350 domain-containing protein [Micrococcales bacterium]|nr:DUF4350 domain-containing protein [Micrococcales bacterium]
MSGPRAPVLTGNVGGVGAAGDDAVLGATGVSGPDGDRAAPGAPGAAAPGAAIVGDGTTARSRAARRWRRRRPALVVLALLVAGGLLALLPAPRTSITPLAPDNTGGNGAQALATILRQHGVTVTYVTTVAAAERATAGGGTLLVAGGYPLTQPDATRIAAIGAHHLVLVAATAWLDVLAPGVGPAYGGGSAPAPRAAACDDADALAAGTVTVTGALTASGPGVVTCFPMPGSEPGGPGAYAVTTSAAGHRVTVLADSTPLTNGALATDGNAALAIRILGRDAHLTWFVPTTSSSGSDSGSEPIFGGLVPPWLGLLGAQGLVVLLVVAVWRGRRLGPVVAERLPVVVRATETTRGRGRLYRRARAYGHAAAALRAGTAARAAARLGLPRSAGAPATIDAISRATARPPDEVARLLYGPPPTDERALATLAGRLATLESEVHRS